MTFLDALTAQRLTVAALLVFVLVIAGAAALRRGGEPQGAVGGGDVTQLESYTSANVVPNIGAAAAPARQPATPPPEVNAASYAIVERSCGALIWGKQEHERLPPASLTKIVTALVVRDRLALDEAVESEVSASKMRGSSVMGLEPGMRLSVTDLLYGLLLRSGNDAALVLARNAGGSTERFVEEMNQKAGELGLRDTHFTNPHGLDNPGLYSSAFDMAQAGMAFLADPVLAGMSSTAEYAPAWSGPALRNGNKLLKRYEGAFGVKTGYTEAAHQTFVGAAHRDGRDVIVSLFGSKDRYADAILLLDWAFANPPACG
jgi:D-alanyl-D-alanine carboxypeptidase